MEIEFIDDLTLSATPLSYSGELPLRLSISGTKVLANYDAGTIGQLTVNVALHAIHVFHVTSDVGGI